MFFKFWEISLYAKVLHLQNNSRLGFTVVNSTTRDKPQGLFYPALVM